MDRVHGLEGEIGGHSSNLDPSTRPAAASSTPRARGVVDAAASGDKVNGHTLATFSIFATFPAPYFNGGIVGPLIDQIVSTGVLLLYIAAVVDLRNTAVKANLGPLIVGFSVAATGMPFGANAGYAINPARDLGGHLDYTDKQITVTLDRPDSPRVAHALELLTDELNADPACPPGDHRALIYRLTPA